MFPYLNWILRTFLFHRIHIKITLRPKKKSLIYNLTLRYLEHVCSFRKLSSVGRHLGVIRWLTEHKQAEMAINMLPWSLVLAILKASGKFLCLRLRYNKTGRTIFNPFYWPLALMIKLKYFCLLSVCQKEREMKVQHPAQDRQTLTTKNNPKLAVLIDFVSVFGLDVFSKAVEFPIAVLYITWTLPCLSEDGPRARGITVRYTGKNKVNKHNRACLLLSLITFLYLK